MKTNHSSTRKNRRRHRTPRALGFQNLEKREMMAADVGLSDTGVLTIDADSQAADVGVYDVWNRVLVTSRDASGVHYNTFNKTQVKKIVFQGSNLADEFTNRTDIADRIFGRGGADVLRAGRGNSYIEGGWGNDKLYGGAGHDTIRGGAGADTIHGEGGNDHILAGSGADRVYGGDGHDRIYGGSGADSLNGGAGNDRIRGGGGVDTIRGGAGHDTLFGDAGNDWIYGDDWFGHQGADRLIGGAGEDKLYGGGGADRLEGNAGRDYLFGGGGDDTLLGGYGADRLLGGWGVDHLYGGPGRDYIDGGAMRDIIGEPSGGDIIETTLHAQLNIDSLYSIKASDGQPWGSTNEVYLMVAGRQGGVDFGPVRVNPARHDHWHLDTGDSQRNISLWHGNLKAGESVDFVVSLFDQDSAGWDALAAFGKGLLTALPAIPSMLAGAFPIVMAQAAAGVQDAVTAAVKAGGTNGDDLLGVFVVHLENVNGRISTTWRAASHAIMYEVNETSAGDTARFRTQSSDGEFSIRASVVEA